GDVGFVDSSDELDYVSHGHLGFGELLEAGQRCGQCQEAEEVSSLAVIPDCQTAISGQPRDRPLDDPPVTAETLTGLDSLAGDPNRYATLPDPSSQFQLV